MEKNSLVSKYYWLNAAKNFTNLKMITFAALIVAFRVIVKAFRIPLAAGLNLTFDCYINALGSIVYGPVMGLAVGAVSDTLGCILFPSGAYFFPFIFVEMLSSFIFGIFLWNRDISLPRILAAKFSVNLICNIVITSYLMKWYYMFLGDVDKAVAYKIVNSTRIAKNLVLFPLESVLIAIILTAFLPALKNLGIIDKNQKALKVCKKDIITIILCTAFSVCLILLYIFVLKDFISKK